MPLGRSRRDPASDYKRLEEKRRALSEATHKWVQLLRDMERDGQTSDPNYERYFQAYIKAQQQEKRVDLELFNLQQGLST
jgi:hypothetical protein